MTVQDLIQKLQTLPPTAEVVFPLSETEQAKIDDAVVDGVAVVLLWQYQ
jgi:hypothetical protein